MSSHPFNLHVGSRIAVARQKANMPQESLAEALKISCTQIEKYEQGINRISCAQLFEISLCLDTPLVYFMDEFKSAPSEKPNSFSIDRFTDGFQHESASALKALGRDFF